MILSDELEEFRNDLAGTLELYQGKLAIDIGHASLRKFADTLDTKRKMYRAALSADSAKAATKAQHTAVTRLISNIGALAGLLRELAVLAESFSKPQKPGELSASRDDLSALRGQFAEVMVSIEKLIEFIDQVKKVLVRRPRGAVNSDPRSGDNRPYRAEPITAISEYRRKAR